jgi:predicted nucleotidyltransferase
MKSAAESSKTSASGARFVADDVFGSRAGGDFGPNSDADVAVFLDHVSEPIREQMGMCDDAHDIWMETSIRIEPWALEEASLTDPDWYRAARLVKTIRREGVRASMPEMQQPRSTEATMLCTARPGQC